MVCCCVVCAVVLTCVCCCQLRLWSVKCGQLLVCFYHADKPVFSLDCQYLLYIDSGQTLITYCLSRMAPVRYLPCDTDDLQVLPVRRHVVLMTSSLTGDVSLCDFIEGRHLLTVTGVSAGGLLDVSKDGRLAVDARLQVFNVDTGELVSRLHHDDSEPVQLVRLTDDGVYVVWLDKWSVRVSRVSDGSLVAHTCTHERPTSLSMLHHGYVLVVGREDGRMLMMTLVTDARHMQLSSCTQTAAQRSSVIHNCEWTCCERANGSFDVLYRHSVQSVRDSELVRASDNIRTTLVHRAKAPLLSTATSLAASSLAASPLAGSPVAAGDQYRRSYSSLTGDHELTCSSDDVSAHDDGRCAVLSDMQRRSQSVTDLLGVRCDTGAVLPAHRAHRLLSYLWEFGVSIRSRRKKHRRPTPADIESRDRMPSV